MKKYVRSFSLALLLLCLLFSSCGEAAPLDDADAAPDPGLTLSRGGYLLYDDLYFYTAPSVKGKDDSETLKYISLPSDETEGAPVYNDALNENDDPFRNLPFGFSAEIVVDEEATAENGGIPVLIAALPFDPPDGETLYHRFISYNMATGQTKELCADVGDLVGPFGLYGDTIYYTRFVGRYTNDLQMGPNEGEYALYALPKTGGSPKKLSLTNETGILLETAQNGKLYFISGDKELYSYDPAKDEVEHICKYGTKIQIRFYIDGNIYYQENFRTEKKEGYYDLTVYDLYRQPIEGMKDLTAENGELVLADLISVDGPYGKKFSYEFVGEGHSYESAQFDHSVLHEYDTESGKSETVYDHSEEEGILWSLRGINEKYMLMRTFSEDPAKKFDESIINRATGERRVIRDMLWWS